MVYKLKTGGHHLVWPIIGWCFFLETFHANAPPVMVAESPSRQAPQRHRLGAAMPCAVAPLVESDEEPASAWDDQKRVDQWGLGKWKEDGQWREIWRNLSWCLSLLLLNELS